MLKYRLIFGPIMIVGALLLFWLDSQLDQWEIPPDLRWLFNDRSYPPQGMLLMFFGCLLIPLAARELVAMLKAIDIKVHSWVITVGSVLAALTIYSTPKELTAATGVTILSTLLITCFMTTMIWHARHTEIKGVVASAGATMFGVIYLGILMGFLMGIRRWHSAWVLVAVILMTKACDIGGYTFGRLFGKHKMIPWLSPGKTWEGLAGGVFFSLLAGIGFALLTQYTDMDVSYRTAMENGEMVLQSMDHNYPIWAGAVLGVILGLVGQVGDLTVSAFKRDSGLKDSGNTVPGFGGLLDVLDSPLLVGVVAYWLLWFFDLTVIMPSP